MADLIPFYSDPYSPNECFKTYDNNTTVSPLHQYRALIYVKIYYNKYSVKRLEMENSGPRRNWNFLNNNCHTFSRLQHCDPWQYDSTVVIGQDFKSYLPTSMSYVQIIVYLKLFDRNDRVDRKSEKVKYVQIIVYLQLLDRNDCVDNTNLRAGDSNSAL